MDNNNIVTICATEQDGLNVRTLCICIQIQNTHIDKLKTEDDIINAIKEACDEYIRTDEGRQQYEYNCGCFNWADFEPYVPNSICRKHGFAKIDSLLSTIERNWDEQLAELEENENE